MKSTHKATKEERIQIAKECLASGNNYGEIAKKYGVILISIKNVFYPLALSNAHDGITRKVVDCLAETVYHLFQCSKYLIAKSSGS